MCTLKHEFGFVSQELGIPTHFFIYECSAEPSIRTSILALVYGSLVILHLLALYFAFQTRKVKVKGLNDAKYIAITVYTTTTVITIILVTSFSLSGYVNVYATIYSAGICLGASLMLGFIFVPKVYQIMLLSNGGLQTLSSDGVAVQGSRG